MTAGAGIFTLVRCRYWRVDTLVACVAVAAIIPLFQALGGLFNIPTEAPLVSIYLLGIALAVLVARESEASNPRRLIDATFAALLIASILSTGIALCQWLGVDAYGPLLAPIPYRDRPVANVGQPNNLATLLGWGLASIWWTHARGKLAGSVAVFAAGFVLVGITLTQSRAGVLEVAFLTLVAVLGRRRLGTMRQVPAWLGLALWFVICTFAFEPLTGLFTDQVARSLLDTGSPRERTALLKMVLAAIAERPWFGWGWNQNVTAHVALAERFPMHGTVGNAHNLVLDLIVWTGLPIGILLTAGLAAWLTRAVRKSETPQDSLLLAALGVFAIHAMLELPHVLAYFLFPAAIIMGTLNASTPLPTLFVLPRATVGGLLLAAGVLISVMFDEYKRIEQHGVEVALQAARLGPPTVIPAPRVFVLQSLEQGLAELRTAPSRDLPPEALDRFRKAVTRYPTRSGLFRYAVAAALNQRPEDARWALEVLCDLQWVSVCQAAAHDWAVLKADGRPELAVVHFPEPDGSVAASRTRKP